MIATALALVLGATPTAAAAKPSAADLARAEELYDNGRTLFAEGSYAAAAAAFESAHELSGNDDMLFNAALAHDRAGNFEAAIAALDRYRAFAPASERAALDERKKSLQTRLQKQREAAARPAEPDTPDTMYPEGPPVTPHDDVPPPRSDRDRDRDRDRNPTSRRTPVRPWAWSLLGTGGALAISATALGAAALAHSRAAARRCVGPDDAPLCPETARDDARLGRGLAIGTDISFALASGLLVAFIAIAAVDARRAKRRGAVAARRR
ncbi:MAG: tetratricopeptide repeat protein [Nannocystaceae bacterium]